ncbi:MAG: zf-HC2 domain-containing protein [Candidatus Udaeobacter sp.]
MPGCESHPDQKTLEQQILSQLPESESARIERHLFDCEPCLQLASDLHQFTISRNCNQVV